MALTKEVIAQEKKILKFKGVKAKKQKAEIRAHAFS
jgi:hypothetical protein